MTCPSRLLLISPNTCVWPRSQYCTKNMSSLRIPFHIHIFHAVCFFTSIACNHSECDYFKSISLHNSCNKPICCNTNTLFGLHVHHHCMSPTYKSNASSSNLALYWSHYINIPQFKGRTLHLNVWHGEIDIFYSLL